MNPLDFSASRVIVMAAPLGARQTRALHSALPLTIPAIADCSLALADIGVSVLHLHVRDADGRHTIDPDRYREATAAVRALVGDRLIIQVTSEAVGRYSATEQMAMVRTLRPEAVSLALRELCPDEASEADAGRFFASLRKLGTWPQYIIYSTDELRRFDQLRRRGFFGDDDPFCLLVLGHRANEFNDGIEQLDDMRKAVDTAAFPWAACQFGKTEHLTCIAATDTGGHVRIGFENNLHMADGSLARDNAALVRQYMNWLDGKPRRAATADEIRATWRIGHD